MGRPIEFMTEESLTVLRLVTKFPGTYNKTQLSFEVGRLYDIGEGAATASVDEAVSAGRIEFRQNGFGYPV